MTQPPVLTRIYSDPKEINKKADKTLEEALTAQFPIQGKHFTINVANVHAVPKNFGVNDEKDAILKSKSLTYPIVGDITLTSNATGNVVDGIHNFPLMDAFHITGKHTLVYKGNNYIVSNLLQLKPGVYTRTRENTGELESHFNTGKGANFRIVLEPKTQVFNLELAGSSVPIAPLLTQVFHLSSDQIEHYIPKEVWQNNLAFAQGKEDRLIKAMYSHLVYTKDMNLSTEKMAEAVREALEASTLDAGTTKATLGQPFETVRPETILETLKKLVAVHRGDVPEDNRDSLEFKRVQNLPDFLATRFAKGQETVRRVQNNLKFGLEKIDQNNPKIRDAVPSKPYSKVYSSYLQKSSLISTPSETNPIESLENVGKVTVLGPEEGGIGEERSVPMAARNIDASHLGILDPARTPESGHAGIDQRFTITAMRDQEGNLYARVKDLHGKVQNLSTQQMMKSVIGFPDSVQGDTVQVQDHGSLRRVPISKVQYWLSDPSSMYTVTTNLVPFLNSNHPGRLTMAGKAIPQALSLANREAPLVQTVTSTGSTFVSDLARHISNNNKTQGTVIRVTPDEVHVRAEDGTLEKIQAVHNLPFNMKGFFDDEKPLVQVGQKIDAHTPVFENNYTNDGTLALGKNLSVAYMPWRGFNHEDGIVISEDAAKSMDSHHAYKVDYDVTPETVAKKDLVKRFYPGKFTPAQLAKLDTDGYAKPGEILQEGDPVLAVLERREPSPEDRLLGRLHKSLVNPYRLRVEMWTHPEPASVVDAHTASSQVRLILRSVKPLEVGDKLTGLHGNKGIVSLILPSDKMPYSKETGKPVDLLLNPASVTSRINLGQVMETVASKIAEKTGTPYRVKNFSGKNNIKGLADELKAHGLSDTEDLVDPATGKVFPKVLTGKQYILKLYKTTDSNYSARSTGGYDPTGQPVKGGEEGSKAVGYMEMLGLLGSDARHNLKEITTLKSENNEDYWAKFIKGQPLPKPKVTFATQKFMGYLKGLGVKVEDRAGNLIASPLTSKEVLAQSNGELTNPLRLNARNLEPEAGGLYDPVITGGMSGTKWSHYTLAEPVVNPMFETPVKSILGLTSQEFDNIHSGKYGILPVNGSKTHFSLIDTATGKQVKEIKT